MKAHKIIKSVLALLLVVIAVSSCQEKMKGFGFTKGEAVRFSVGTEGSLLDTKAAYSGVKTGGVERIDWQAGDMIRIYCAQASEASTKYADYEVTSVEASGANSKAHIEGTGGVGLRWGDETNDHVFYGMFLSPAVAGNGTSLNDGTMTGFIPATQKPVSLNATPTSAAPNFTALADLTSEYMVAKNTVTAGTQTIAGGVILDFKPFVTAIEFTISNGFATDGDFNIKNILLTSASYDIAGAFTADLTGLDGTNYPICKSTAEGKTVTMDFTDIPDYTYTDVNNKYITLTKGQSLRFTVFLKPGDNSGNPVNVNDLTFQINKSDNSWIRTRLGYTDGSGVVFPCHKKSFVTGLLVPEGAQWTVNYGPAGDDASTTTLTSWNTGVAADLNMQKSLIQFIDLGLPSGTKWANVNLGATAETGTQSYGDHYAWGELSTKPTYTLSNYQWPLFEKYNGTDHFYTLQPEDDIVHHQLGGRRHIPTPDQYVELFNSNYTYSVWTSNYKGSGVNGYLVESKVNGNTIFLPAAGLSGSEGRGLESTHGCYWTSSLNPKPKSSTPYPSCAIDMDFRADLPPAIIKPDDDSERLLGQSIRAVEDPEPILTGDFSIGNGKKVRFSRGNLQYQALTGTWRFAASQFENIVKAAGNTTSSSGRDTQYDWIDLFGWAATGKNVNPNGEDPWSNSQSPSQYKTLSTASTSEVLTRENGGDWGVCMGEGWRTLSISEWQYLLGESTERAGKSKTPVTVRDYPNCLVIASDACLNGYVFDKNKTEYSAEEWAEAEAAGVICLGPTGFRNGSNVGDTDAGYYWTATAASSAINYANMVYINNKTIDWKNPASRSIGRAVRLVKDVTE